MQVLASGNGRSNCFVIDGMKFLMELGFTEENVTAEAVAEALFNLSEEERNNLFSKCNITSERELLKYFGNEVIINKPLLLPEIFDTQEFRDYTPFEEKYFERTPEVIKKELKYEKNPMRIKQLNQELTAAYRSLKGKWF